MSQDTRVSQTNTPTKRCMPLTCATACDVAASLLRAKMTAGSGVCGTGLVLLLLQLEKRVVCRQKRDCCSPSLEFAQFRHRFSCLDVSPVIPHDDAADSTHFHAAAPAAPAAPAASAAVLKHRLVNLPMQTSTLCCTFQSINGGGVHRKSLVNAKAHRGCILARQPRQRGRTGGGVCHWTEEWGRRK